MKYWFLPLIFALSVSAHGKSHDHKQGHKHPTTSCAKDEWPWYDGRCVKKECPPDWIRDSSGACMCPGGQVLNSIGQCGCPPGTEKASGGNYCQKICKHDPPIDIDCLEGFTPTPEKDRCICLPGLVQEGYDCVCPYEGQDFDGEKCVCPTGQHLEGYKCVCPWEGQVFDGKDCVCPAGTISSSARGVCVTPPPNCPSGVQTGKCYTFTFGNGQLFGYDSSARIYTTSPDLQFSKFQVCTDELCSLPTEDVKAGMPFNIQEIVGQAPPNSTQRSRIFVSNAKNEGPYLTRTPFFITSGRFIIAKWPGGKHCLGGYDTGVGVGLTYETGILGATMPPDDQSCIVFTLTEVPCDIRACIEGNKTGTPATPTGGEASSNASMPLGSGEYGYT